MNICSCFFLVLISTACEGRDKHRNNLIRVMPWKGYCNILQPMSSASDAKSHGHWSKKTKLMEPPRTEPPKSMLHFHKFKVVQMILKLRCLLSNMASFHFWTSDCCLVDSVSILPKRTKTKTLEKQQTPVMQKKGYDFMPNSCDIDPSKVPIFPSKSCLPRYWSLHRRQAVDRPSCVRCNGLPLGLRAPDGSFLWDSEVKDNWEQVF